MDNLLSRLEYGGHSPLTLYYGGTHSTGRAAQRLWKEVNNEKERLSAMQRTRVEDNKITRLLHFDSPRGLVMMYTALPHTPGDPDNPNGEFIQHAAIRAMRADDVDTTDAEQALEELVEIVLAAEEAEAEAETLPTREDFPMLPHIQSKHEALWIHLKPAVRAYLATMYADTDRCTELVSSLTTVFSGVPGFDSTELESYFT